MIIYINEDNIGHTFTVQEVDDIFAADFQDAVIAIARIFVNSSADIVYHILDVVRASHSNPRIRVSDPRTRISLAAAIERERQADIIAAQDL